MEKYKHIIWDWNGTILDDVDLCIEIINKMLQKRNKKIINFEVYKDIFTFPVKTYYERAGFDFSTENFEEVAKEFIGEYDIRKFECSLHKGIEEFINKKCQQGISHSILSASNIEGLKDTVEKYGIGNKFLDIKGLDNNLAKSKIDLGKKCLEELEFRREEIILIGDTLHDLEVAKSLGIACKLISTGHQSHKKLKEKSMYVYRSIEELEY